MSLTATRALGLDTKTATVTVAPVCTVAEIAALRSPLRLRISGAGFPRGCRVLVNGSPVPTARTRAGTRLTVGGAVVRRMLRFGSTMVIVVRSPSGGVSETCTFKR